MNITLPAKLALLLTVASPFSAYSQSECEPLSGNTSFMSVSGTNSCPQRTFKLIGSTQCEVVLHEPQCTGVDGQWFATYRYTGLEYTSTYDPIYTELNVIPRPNHEEIGWRPAGNENLMLVELSDKVQNSFAALTSGQIALSKNDNVINTNVKTLSDLIADLSTYVEASKTSSDLSKSAADSAKLSADAAKAASQSALLQTQTNADTLHRIENSMLTLPEIDASLNAVQQNIQSSVAGNLLVTSNAILQSLDANNDEVLLAVDDVKNQVVSVQNQLYDPMTREAKHNELLQAANTAAYIAEDSYNRINSTRELVKDVEDLSEDILQILQEGSGGGDGATVDMTQTNDLLNAIKTDAKSASITAEIQRQAITDQLNTVTNAMNNNAQGLSMQLGQQLSGIQSAIENGSGGGGGTDDDTETNEKLDGLGEKLDGIKGALDGFSDTTGMASQLNDSVTNSNAELSTEMDTMFEGFGTEEKMSQLEITVSGMVNDSGLSDYDTVDKVRSALSSATTISQVFDVSRASCAPYAFWTKEINFCPAAEKSSMVLEYFIWAITAIFAFLHITAFLSKLRTE